MLGSASLLMSLLNSLFSGHFCVFGSLLLLESILPFGFLADKLCGVFDRSNLVFDDLLALVLVLYIVLNVS